MLAPPSPALLASYSLLGLMGQPSTARFPLSRNSKHIQLPDHEALFNLSQGKLIPNIVGLISFHAAGQSVVFSANIPRNSMAMKRSNSGGIGVQLDVEVGSVRRDSDTTRCLKVANA